MEASFFNQKKLFDYVLTRILAQITFKRFKFYFVVVVLLLHLSGTSGNSEQKKFTNHQTAKTFKLDFAIKRSGLLFF